MNDQDLTRRTLIALAGAGGLLGLSPLAGAAEEKVNPRPEGVPFDPRNAEGTYLELVSKLKRTMGPASTQTAEGHAAILKDLNQNGLLSESEVEQFTKVVNLAAAKEPKPGAAEEINSIAAQLRDSAQATPLAKTIAGVIHQNGQPIALLSIWGILKGALEGAGCGASFGVWGAVIGALIGGTIARFS